MAVRLTEEERKNLLRERQATARSEAQKRIAERKGAVTGAAAGTASDRQKLIQERQTAARAEAEERIAARKAERSGSSARQTEYSNWNYAAERAAKYGASRDDFDSRNRARNTVRRVTATPEAQEYERLVSEQEQMRKRAESHVVSDEEASRARDIAERINAYEASRDYARRQEAEKLLEDAKAKQAAGKRASEYAALMREPDFAELSQYRSTQHGEPKYNSMFGGYDDTGFDNLRYDFINGNETAREVSKSAESDTPELVMVGVSRDRLLNMTPDEISVYNYLYNKQGEEAADEFIEFIATDPNYTGGSLNARMREQEEAEMREYADEHPVLASGYSVLTSPLKTVSYAGQLADYLDDGALEKDAGYNRLSYMNTAIRNKVSKTIEESGKWGPVGSFLYNTGMSLADFALQGKTFGKIGEGLALAIMGTGAAADETIKRKDQGLSDGQAFALGTIAGFAEIITERVSLETLLGEAAKGRGALAFFLSNAAAEGSEEGASDLINWIADVIVAGDKGEWRTAVRDYELRGMSESEAFGHALADKAAEIGLDVLGGAISGGIMATPGTVSRAKYDRRVGNAVSAGGDAAIQAEIERGLASPSDSKSRALARKLQQQVEKGNIPSAGKVGQLTNLNELETQERAAQVQREAEIAEDRQDARSIVTKLGESIPQLRDAEPVAALTGNEFSRGKKTLREQVADFFASIGNKVFRKGLGTVELNMGGIRSDIAHGMGRAKAVTFAAVPDVIIRGQQIDYQQNWKGRGYESYVFAAPVNIGETRSYVAAVVLRDSKNRFYLHEVVDENGNFLKITQDTPDVFKTGVTVRDGVTSTPEVSTDSVPRAQGVVNGDEDRKVVPITQDTPDAFKTGVTVQDGVTGAPEVSTDSVSRAEQDVNAKQAQPAAQTLSDEITRQWDRARESGGTSQERNESSQERSATSSEPMPLTVGEEFNRRNRAALARNEVERTGILAGARDEDISAAERISRAVGREVRFYDSRSAESSTAAGANGYYKGGVIYVNAESGNPVAQIISHELTHSLEGSKLYSQLSDMVLARMRESGESVEDARKQKAALYERSGAALADNAAVDRELVAEYIEKHLLTDEDAVIRMVRENRGLAVRIKNRLDSLLAKLGSDAARERAFVRRTVNLYARALDDAENVTGRARRRTVDARARAEAAAASRAEETAAETSRERLRQAGERLAAGEMSDEEYDREAEQAEPLARERELREAREYGQNRTEYSFGDEENPYAGRSMTEDSEIYSYDFLTSLPDMQTVTLPDVDTVRDANGMVDKRAVVDMGIKNARSVGTERDGSVFVRNSYTGTQLRVDSSSIRHGLNGVQNRLLTNARLGAVIGDVVKNAVPINALHNKAAGVTGTYAMAGYATDSNGREFVAVVTVEQRSGDISGVEVYDVTHAVSGRQKRSERVGTKPSGSLPLPPNASTISIADLLEIVKGTHQSVLSEDVLAELGETRNPEGYYNDKVRYSISEDSEGRELSDEMPEWIHLPSPDEDTASDPDIRYSFEDEEPEGLRLPSPEDEDISANTEFIDLPTQEDVDAPSGPRYEAERIPMPEDRDAPNASYWRKKLSTRARSYLGRAMKEASDTVAARLGVPKGQVADTVGVTLDALADMYMTDGTLDENTVKDAFETVYNSVTIIDGEYYEMYKPVRKYLRETTVYVSDAVKNEFTDWGSFRRSVGSRIKIRTGEGAASAMAVDEVYSELSQTWPDLFPEDISVPSSQLERMDKVYRSIERVEKTLDEAAGESSGEVKQAARHDFNEAVYDLVARLRDVRNFERSREVSRTAKDAKEAENRDRLLRNAEARGLSEEEAASLYKTSREQFAAFSKAKALNLLTDSDRLKLGQLLRGEIQTGALDAETDNVRGITAVYEAARAYEDTMTALRGYEQSRAAALRDEAAAMLEGAEKWHDKSKGYLYARETAERNVRDVVGDEKKAQEIIDTYFTPVHKNEAESTKMKNRLRDTVRELNLSRRKKKGHGMSEAAMVQFLGEAEDYIEVLSTGVNAGNPKAKRGGMTLEEWRGAVETARKENPDLDYDKIDNAIETFRKLYDDLFKMINEARVRNGYEPISYRRGYFPHFQSEQRSGVLGWLGKAFGVQTEVTNLPTTINGRTEDFKPGIRWMGAALERKGNATTFDAVEGFDRYLEVAADVIWHTDDIQRLRALATATRERTTDESIAEYIERIRADDNLTEEEKQNQIRAKVDEGRYELSNFAGWLDEYTNLLAGKKSRADRQMEADAGRGMYNVLKALESRVGANMVGFNVRSATTNFIPITQGWADLGGGTVLRGMWDTLKAHSPRAKFMQAVRNGGASIGDIIEALSDNMPLDDFSDMSEFLTNRRGSERLVQTRTQEIVGKTPLRMARDLMETVDRFSSETLVRARYAQNVKRGLSEQSAMDEADAWAAGVMAARSKGSMPTLFSRANPLTKLFTQFQLEVNNQFSYLMKDVPREHREKGMASLAWALLKFAIGAWLFNELSELFTGYRPALDPIGILNDTVGDLTGYELPNVWSTIGGVFTGHLPSLEKTKQEGVYGAGKNLAKNVAEELPFVGGLLGGGRIPVSSAKPDFNNVWSAATNPDWAPEKKLRTAADELSKPLTYLLPPAGGGAVRRVIEGAATRAAGGSYTVNSKGEDILQYPEYTDEGAGSFWDVVKSMIMGKSSLDTAQDWVRSGFDSLSAKQTTAYREMTDAGMGQRDAFELLREIEGDEMTKAEKMRAVVDATDIEEARLAAMKTVLTEAAYDKVAAAGEFGVSSESWTELMETLPDYDDGNGSYTQAEVADALGSMKRLTREEKAVLWQAQAKNWSPKKNPYDTRLGEEVADRLNREEEEEEMPEWVSLPTP